MLVAREAVMGEKAALRDVLYRVLAVTYRYAERVEVIEYPHSMGRRSIDLAVRLRDGRSVLVKVAMDIRRIPKSEVAELADVAASMETPAVVAAELYQGERMERGVLYERLGLPALSPETLEDVLRGEGVYVYQSKDSFKVRINPERMRARRLELGLSLGNVASYLGVSRRTVYEYERGTIDPTIEKAERLVRLLGDEILEPVDPLVPPRPNPRRSRPSDEAQMLVFQALASRGFKLAHARRTAPDITGSRRAGESGAERVAIVVERGSEGSARLEERAVYTLRIAEATGAMAFGVARGGAAAAIKRAGIEVAKRPEDVIEFIEGGESGEAGGSE